MASRRMVPLVLLALTVAACSGGEEVDVVPPTTAAPTTPAPTAPVTSAPTTTTTAPPTTPPTTAPPTTSAPTEPPVTASTLPLPVPDGFTLEEVQVIDRDFREGYQQLYIALANVNDETAVQAALAFVTGDEAVETADVIEQFRTNNRRVLRLDSPPESFEILQGPTRLTSGDIALVICHVAPYRTVETGPGSGTTETVINDGVVTQQIRVDLRLADGIWKRSERLLDGQWPGVVRCQDMS